VTRRHRSEQLAGTCVFPLRARDAPGPRGDDACARDCFSGAELVQRPRARGRISRHLPILVSARQAHLPPRSVMCGSVHLRYFVASRSRSLGIARVIY
jgi:hypothetical protein